MLLKGFAQEGIALLLGAAMIITLVGYAGYERQQLSVPLQRYGVVCW